MMVITSTPELLVLRANRILPAIVGIVATPFVVGPGQPIVEKSDTAWLGWMLFPLRLVMVGGIWALFVRLMRELDRRTGLVSYSLKALFFARSWVMPIDALDRVDLHERHSPRGSIYTLNFLARSGSAVAPLRVREFWTKGAADVAMCEVGAWLLRCLGSYTVADMTREDMGHRTSSTDESDGRGVTCFEDC